MNIYSLYKRNCDLCGKNIISSYQKDCPIKVYCPSCWWSDSWDGTEYGQEYDPERNFFDQLLELRNRSSIMSLENQSTTLVNTEYASYSSNNKNSYLTYFADFVENCCYCSVMNTVKDSMDCYRIRESESCCGSIGVFKCYRTFFSEECDNCLDVYFSKNCSGCSNCFGCMDLRKKSYCIYNKQYSKEDYEAFIKKINTGSFEAIAKYRKESADFWNKLPYKFYYGNALNINVSGNYVYESKNTKDAYMATSAENSRFVQMLSVPSTKDSYDYTGWGDAAEMIYECQSVGMGASNMKFSIHCYPNVMDCEYSYYAINCKNVFGCVNLKKKEYCILNKQYSKEEYEKLKERIIADIKEKPYVDSLGRKWGYGEFFPLIITPFGYNETMAMDYFPMTKNEVLKNGFAWSDVEQKQYEATIKASDLPDDIKDVGEDILNQVIECENCRRSFRMIKLELDLLKRLNFPLPRQCPECRRKERFSKVNLPKLWKRICQCSGQKSENGVYSNTVNHFHGEVKCPNEFETSYAPERKEIVYCEQCYNAEVV